MPGLLRSAPAAAEAIRSGAGAAYREAGFSRFYPVPIRSPVEALHAGTERERRGGTTETTGPCPGAREGA